MTRWGAFLAIAIAFSGSTATAQIVPDNTLGGESSQLNPNVDLNGQLVDLIEGGAIRGNNLFHSFLEFNINNGQGAYFANPAEIFNIFSRVTGGNSSQILGTLGVNGDANLFLLNPNGILFGPNARLDIRGSFVGTTADSFVFGNGLEYSAIAPGSPSPLLTVNITPGLQYGSNAGDITNRGILETGGDLLLGAGNLDLQGQLQAGGDLTLRALDTLKIRDRVASPFVAASRGDFLVQGDRAVDIFALNHSDSGLFSGGNMTFRSANPVGGDAHYWSGGNFRIEQLDGNLGDLYSPKDPIIRATGDVNFDAYLGLSLHILAGGNVTIPDGIFVLFQDPTNGLVDTVTLSDGSALSIDGKNQPTLDIRAGTSAFNPPGITGSFLLPSTSPSTSVPATGSDINIGTSIQISQPNSLIYLSGNNINMTGNINISSSAGNGGQVIFDARENISFDGNVKTSSTAGNAGDIKFLANGDISLSGSLEALTQTINSNNAGDITFIAGNNLSSSARITSSSDFGDTGNINLQSKTGNINILDGEIVSETFGAGDAGNINITTANNFTLANLAELSALSRSSGDAGDITVNANNIIIQNQGRIFANTAGTGNGGNITLNSPSINLDRAFIFANTVRRPFSSPNPLGDAGNITFNTQSLTLQNGTLVSAFTQSEGRGGNINVNAAGGTVEIKGTDPEGIFSGLYLGATNSGQAGDLNLNASQLILEDRGRIFADTSGSGNAGDVKININNLFLRSGGSISAATTNVGKAGTLEINASNSIELNGNSGLNLQSTNVGNAGGIKISTNGDLIVQNGSDITVQGTGMGNPGNIEISSRSLLLKNQGSITALTTSGEDANIQLLVQDSIILRNNSEIVTEALGTGNGGNIRLEAGGFILAFLSENSDIVANAFQGQGGNIYAKALGIFGFRQFRDRRTSESDFTASSQLGIDGVVTLDVGDFQPDVELPDRPGVPRLDRGCRGNSRVSQGSGGEFYETGLGGVASRPTDTLNSTSIRIPWVEIESDASELTEIPTEIIEATGWHKLSSGEVILTGDRASVPVREYRSSNVKENQECYPLLMGSP